MLTHLVNVDTTFALPLLKLGEHLDGYSTPAALITYIQVKVCADIHRLLWSDEICDLAGLFSSSRFTKID